MSAAISGAIAWTIPLVTRRRARLKSLVAAVTPLSYSSVNASWSSATQRK